MNIPEDSHLHTRNRVDIKSRATYLESPTALLIIFTIFSGWFLQFSIYHYFKSLYSACDLASDNTNAFAVIR